MTELDYIMQEMIQQQKRATKAEELKKIGGESNTYYNSVNLLCGRQGSGKSYTSMKEIILASQEEPTHLVICICKDENSEDPTVKALAPLLFCDIEFVGESCAEDYVKNILLWKKFYNEIKDNHLEKRIEQTQKQECFKNLHIHNFSKPFLHTILLFNDIAKSKLLNNPTNYFNQLIPICRHIQTSFFLCVQFWKSVPTEIKANITTAFIFGGFSRQQLFYILSQLPTTFDKSTIYEQYQQLNKNDKLIVDCETGETTIEERTI